MTLKALLGILKKKIRFKNLCFVKNNLKRSQNTETMNNKNVLLVTK